jgi:hypothetical protein
MLRKLVLQKGKPKNKVAAARMLIRAGRKAAAKKLHSISAKARRA